MEPYDQTYRQMFDEELLDLAGQADQLMPAAEQALRVELHRRGLEEEARRRQQESRAAVSASESTDPDLSKLASVFWAESEIEGRVTQNILRESGIESVLRRQVVSVVFPGACEILVLDSQEEQARRIIADYQQSRELPPDETAATDE